MNQVQVDYNKKHAIIQFRGPPSGPFDETAGKIYEYRIPYSKTYTKTVAHLKHDYNDLKAYINYTKADSTAAREIRFTRQDYKPSDIARGHVQLGRFKFSKPYVTPLLDFDFDEAKQFIIHYMLQFNIHKGGELMEEKWLSEIGVDSYGLPTHTFKKMIEDRDMRDFNPYVKDVETVSRSKIPSFSDLLDDAIQDIKDRNISRIEHETDSFTGKAKFVCYSESNGRHVVHLRLSLEDGKIYRNALQVVKNEAAGKDPYKPLIGKKINKSKKEGTKMRDGIMNATEKAAEIAKQAVEINKAAVIMAAKLEIGRTVTAQIKDKVKMPFGMGKLKKNPLFDIALANVAGTALREFMPNNEKAQIVGEAMVQSAMVEMGRELDLNVFVDDILKNVDLSKLSIKD